MKKILSFIVIALLLNSVPAFSQKVLKIGHFDTQKLLLQIPDYQSAQKQIQEYAKQIESDLKKKKQEYNNKVQAYIDDEKANRMNAQQKQAKQEELMAMQQEIENYPVTDKLQEKQNELLTPVLTRMNDAIQAVAKENGFTYIFSTSNIIYSAPDSQDITALVKKKLGI